MQDPSVRVAYIWPVLGLLCQAVVTVCFPSYSSDCHYKNCSRVPVTWITHALIYYSRPIVWPRALGSKKQRYLRGSVLIILIICIYIFQDLYLLSDFKKLANTQCLEIQEVCYLSLKQSHCSFACQGTVIKLTKKLWQPVPKLVHLSPHFGVTFSPQLSLLSCLQKWYFKGVKELLEKATENNTQRLDFITSCRGSLTLSDDLLYFAITVKITTNYLKWFPPLPPLLSLFSTSLSKSTPCFVY